MGELTTVKHVDLSQYMGIWYEVAFLPNRFEKKCIEGSIACYSLMENGMVKVENRCQTSKGVSRAHGVAWVADPDSQAKLKVSFIPFAKYFRWFGGDYWILYLDENYQHVIVGDPSFKYLWFLARTESVSEEVFQKLSKIACEKGFAVNSMIRVRSRIF